ncbi:hypothetical protein G6F37_002890 [Rhizopus arrhizus]|nr:hypothetical protein G6F38_005920 [Rhizopus arrhizus]KAG1161635.1 hypothetical protein G6F37_002890 [Rhizopus arrhizus]
MFLKERLFLSEAFVAVVFGVLAGPLVANGLDPHTWRDYHEITKQLTRCIIAVQVMAVGIELPHHYLKKEWRTTLMFLIPVMMYMWLVSGTIIWGLIRPLSYLEALVISACVCPTDPILANSIVKGKFAAKHVPPHIRNALAAESGANDGMGFPFLFLAIFLIAEDTVGKAVGKWFYITCLFQIVLSCVIGAVVGYVARVALQWSEKRCLIDKPSFLSFAIALALFLMSMTGFSGSDDLLACFVAGNAFSWDEWFRRETEEAHFQEVIDTMLNLSIFVYIGSIIPWWEFNNHELGLEPWRLILVAFLILFFRRLPVVVLLKPAMPAIKTYREAVFSGWFGPIGVGAVFLSTIAKEELESIYEDREKPVSTRIIGPVVLFIVFTSVVIHGTTVPLFKFGKRIHTRTVSITKSSLDTTLSGGSNEEEDYDKDLRLPNPFDENKKMQSSEKMIELVRSTLFNQAESHQAVLNLHQSDSECPEEDFLPDNLSSASTSNMLPSNHPSFKNTASSSKISSTSSRRSDSIKLKKKATSRSNKKSKKEDEPSLKTWFFVSSSSSKVQAARRRKEKERRKRRKEAEKKLKEQKKAERELKKKQKMDTLNFSVDIV